MEVLPPLFPAISQELLHQGLSGPLCAAAGRRGGHTAAPGRGQEGSPPAEAVMHPPFGDP